MVRLTEWGRTWGFAFSFLLVSLLVQLPLPLHAGEPESSQEYQSVEHLELESSSAYSRGEYRAYNGEPVPIHSEDFEITERSRDAVIQSGYLGESAGEGSPEQSEIPEEVEPRNGGAPGSGGETGVSPTALSLPSGEGSMSGMGESFTPNLNTGSGSFSIPIVIPPGRQGMQPQFGLSYTTGSGNGPLGWGWSIGVPAISRQGDKGLPRYNETDRFIYSGGQELVPIDMPEEEAWPNPDWNPHVCGDDIVYYRARLEGAFMRFFYNRSTDEWLVQDKQGNHYYYGESSDTRVETYGGTYQWNLSRMTDIRRATDNGGNDVHFRYLPDGGGLYIQDVFWNSYLGEYGSVEKYQHRLHFAYEERLDKSQSYASGYRIEQNLRMSRVEVSSFDTGPSGERDLTRVYLLNYENPQTSIHSRLGSVQQCGKDWSLTDPGTCLPPVDFYYSEIAGFSSNGLSESKKLPGFGRFNEQVRPLKTSPDVALDDPNVTLLDVNQDGLPDVFMTKADYYGSNHAAIINDGLDGLSETENLMPVSNPSGWSMTLDNSNVRIMDVDGAGNADLLHMPYHAKYHYYRLNGKCDLDVRDCGWIESGEIPLNPAIDFTADADDIRNVDVNNDGLIDIVRTTGSRMEHFLNLSAYPGFEGQFGRVDEAGLPVANQSIDTCLLHRGGPMQFSNGDLQFGDMNGDGLQDIVHVKSGSMAYWPGRGYGRWGEMTADCTPGELGDNAEIELSHTPYFSNPGNEGVMLADVNGDGLTDIVQVRSNAVDLWLNKGDDSFTARHIIEDTPIVRSGEYGKVTLADMNGSGTADIVWGDAGGWYYLDLAGDYRSQDWNGGLKAGLLEQIDNGLGGSTYIEYKSSTELMVDARENDEPWESVAPMPLTVVKRTTYTDHLEEVGGIPRVMVQEYVYRDPYYDAHEAEFKGFGYGEAWDRGVEEGLASCDPESIKRGEAPLAARQWFHRGVRPQCMEPALKSGWGPNSDACHQALHLDNPYLGLTGATIKTETYSPCTGETIGATLSQIEVRHLFENASANQYDDRAVWHVVPNQGLKYVYDPSKTRDGDGELEEHDLVWMIGKEGETANLEKSYYTPASPDGTFHRISGRTEMGEHGFPKDAYYGGFHRYSSDDRYKYADCDQYSQHFEIEYDPATWVHVDKGSYMLGPVTSESGGACENHCTPERPCNWITKEYNADGSIGYGELYRSRVTYWDNPYTGAGESTLIPSWKMYNNYGQVIHEYAGCTSDDLSSCERHKEYAYSSEGNEDLSYSAYIRKEIAYVPDSPVSPFEFNAYWDAGLAQIYQMIGADGSESKVGYDALGRVAVTYGSDPRTGKLCADDKYIKTYEYHYDTAPMPYLVTRVNLSGDYCGDMPAGPTSHITGWETLYTWVDGMGQPYSAVTSGDDHLGSESKYPWLISGMTTYNAKGMAIETCEPLPLSHVPGTPEEMLSMQRSAHASLSSMMPGGKWNCAHQEFDAFGRPTYGYAPDGTTTKAEYHVDSGDSYDHLDLTDACHQGTYASERVDGLGRVMEKVTRHKGDCGSQVQERWVTMQYDALSNPLVVTRFEVAQGQSSESTPNKISRRFIYDSLGRVRENLDVNFGRWQYFYDAIGQLSHTINPTGDQVSYRYDSAGRLLSADHNNDTLPEVEYFYDAYPGDSVLGMTDAVGWEGFPDVETRGRLVAVKDQSGVSISAGDFGSFSENWKKLIKDPLVYHWEARVDGAGRPIYGEDPDGHRSSASYYADGTGKSTFWTDDASNVQKYKIIADTRINMFGQTEWVKYGDASRAEFESWSGYDPVTHRALSTVLQRTVSGQKAALQAFGYQYNRLGMLTGIVDWRGRGPTGYQTQVQQQMLQDVPHPSLVGGHGLPGHHMAAMPQHFSEELPAPAFFNGTDTYHRSQTGWPDGVAPSDASFHYDSLYQLIQEDREYAAAGQGTEGVDGPAESDGKLKGRRAEQLSWSYDWLGSMESWEEESGDGAVPVTAAAWGRALGNIINGHALNAQSGSGCNYNLLETEKTLPTGCYKPEALYFAHNLDQVTAGRGTCVWVQYDEGGRMVEQHIRTGCSACEFDDGRGYDSPGTSCGYKSSIGLPGDDNFEPEISGTPLDYLYYWNALGQLEAAQKFKGGQHVLTMKYLYDAGGSRVIREKSDTLEGPENIRQDLYIAGSYERRQVQLQDQWGNALSFTDPTESLGFKDIDGSRLVKRASGARIQYEVKAGALDMSDPQLFLTFGNHLGSTGAVVDLLTGALVEWKTNYAYGADETGWKNADSKYDNADEPYGFTGKEEDEEVGLHYFGARYYSSYLGRWLSPDPPVVHGQMLGNHYQYCLNSPYIAVDPDGNAANVIAGVVGAVVGAVGGFVSGMMSGGWQNAIVQAGIGAAVGFISGVTCGAGTFAAIAIGSALGAASGFASAYFTARINGASRSEAAKMGGWGALWGGISGAISSMGGQASAHIPMHNIARVAFNIGASAALSAAISLAATATQTEGGLKNVDFEDYVKEWAKGTAISAAISVGAAGLKAISSAVQANSLKSELRAGEVHFSYGSFEECANPWTINELFEYLEQNGYGFVIDDLDELNVRVALYDRHSMYYRDHTDGGVIKRFDNDLMGMWVPLWRGDERSGGLILINKHLTLEEAAATFVHEYTHALGFDEISARIFEAIFRKHAGIEEEGVLGESLIEGRIDVRVIVDYINGNPHYNSQAKVDYEPIEDTNIFLGVEVVHGKLDISSTLSFMEW